MVCSVGLVNFINLIHMMDRSQFPYLGGIEIAHDIAFRTHCSLNLTFPNHLAGTWS